MSRRRAPRMSPVGWRQRDRLSRDQNGTSGRVECECLAAAVRAEDDEAARVLMLGIKLAAFPDFGQGVRGGTGATGLKPATSGVTVRASHNDDRRRSTTIACKSPHLGRFPELHPLCAVSRARHVWARIGPRRVCELAWLFSLSSAWPARTARERGTGGDSPGSPRPQPRARSCRAQHTRTAPHAASRPGASPDHARAPSPGT
jgi:hypothetical protein